MGGLTNQIEQAAANLDTVVDTVVADADTVVATAEEPGAPQVTHTDGDGHDHSEVDGGSGSVHPDAHAAACKAAQELYKASKNIANFDFTAIDADCKEHCKEPCSGFQQMAP